MNLFPMESLREGPPMNRDSSIVSELMPDDFAFGEKALNQSIQPSLSKQPFFSKNQKKDNIPLSPILEEPIPSQEETESKLKEEKIGKEEILKTQIQEQKKLKKKQAECDLCILVFRFFIWKQFVDNQKKKRIKKKQRQFSKAFPAEPLLWGISNFMENSIPSHDEKRLANAELTLEQIFANYIYLSGSKKKDFTFKLSICADLNNKRLNMFQNWFIQKLTDNTFNLDTLKQSTCCIYNKICNNSKPKEPNSSPNHNSADSDNRNIIPTTNNNNNNIVIDNEMRIHYCVNLFYSIKDNNQTKTSKISKSRDRESEIDDIRNDYSLIQGSSALVFILSSDFNKDILRFNKLIANLTQKYNLSLLILYFPQLLTSLNSSFQEEQDVSNDSSFYSKQHIHRMIMDSFKIQDLQSNALIDFVKIISIDASIHPTPASFLSWDCVLWKNLYFHIEQSVFQSGSIIQLNYSSLYSLFRNHPYFHHLVLLLQQHFHGQQELPSSHDDRIDDLLFQNIFQDNV